MTAAVSIRDLSFAYEKDPPHSPQDYIPVDVKERKPERYRKKELSSYVKKAARFFGASKVGIAKLNRDWLYATKVQYSTAVSEKDESERFPELIIDDDIDTAIVFIIDMNREGFQAAPTFLEFASAGWGYSQMSVIIATMSQFIRNLGYKALPCANDTALSVPLAIDAGLGALGRMGILITKEFGPRVRICKVLTNMPLNHDKPDEKFINQVDMVCEGCTRCADVCAYGAIPREGPRNYETKCKSNNPAVKKWYVDVEKCYNGWVDYCSDCGLCISACPFSRMNRYKDPNEFWESEF